jgi:hypothetical protein
MVESRAAVFSLRCAWRSRFLRAFLFFIPPPPAFQFPRLRDGHIHDLLDHPGLDQFLMRPAQRVVVRHLLKPDIRAPVRAILQERHYPAIAFLLMLPKDQAREQLRPSKILAAELRPVFLHACHRQRIGGIQHHPW